MSDLPTFKKFVQIFFSKKIWRQQTLPTYDLTYVLNFAVFFLGYASLCVIKTVTIARMKEQGALLYRQIFHDQRSSPGTRVRARLQGSK